MLKLTRKQLNNLYRWIDVPLHGEKVRVRNNFVLTVDKKMDETSTLRKNLLESFTNRDVEGKPILDDKKNYDIPKEKHEEVLSAITKLLDEGIEITVDKKVIKVLVEILSEYPHDFKIDEGKEYDELLTKLERCLI